MKRIAGTVLSLALAVTTACHEPKKETSGVKKIDDSLKEVDLLKNGAYAFKEYEYSSEAYLDKDVYPIPPLDKVKVDIRGRLFLPEGKGPFPLVIFLHGNHSTCGTLTGPGNPRLDRGLEFTQDGFCPDGQIEVPSYRGFDASAQLLASHGYVVASINANRGVTGQLGSDSFDSKQVRSRGNLVLRHIEELSKWSREGKNDFLRSEGLDLSHKLDLSRVGMMGHSRGGEGIRYAYNLYVEGLAADSWKKRIPDLKFQGLFEIGPVDQGTKEGEEKIHVNATGVAWTVLIPGCDGDVSYFEGVNPYERMLQNMSDGHAKSIVTLWGANHNFFNSEWQVSDAPHTCRGQQVPLWNTSTPPLPDSSVPNARMQLTGSTAQIDVEKSLLAAFFRAHLGGEEELASVFDPQYRLPSQLSKIAPMSREYLPALAGKIVLDPTTVISKISMQGEFETWTLTDYVGEQVNRMTAALQEYAKAHNMGKHMAELLTDENIRSGIAIEGKGLNLPQSIVIPFSEISSAKDFWTLDISLANRKTCYEIDESFMPDCPPTALDNDFQVALVLEDGTVTKTVTISDYVTLDNWLSMYFDKLFKSFSAPEQSHVVIYRYIPILYQTARFELSDFDISDQKIKGVQFSFNSDKDVALIISSMSLNKKP